MLDTVIFDLGGVLVDFHPEQGMRDIGFPEDVVEVFNNNIFSGLWEECDRKPYEDAEIRQLFKTRVPGYEKYVDMLWDNLHPISCAYEYSEKWLKELKNIGMKIYILSNFGKRAFEINSEIYPFLKLTDGKVISYEISHVKPEAQIYDCLIKRFSINPANAVFIDDRQVNIDGANECGIKGILFSGYEKARDELIEMIDNSKSLC